MLAKRIIPCLDVDAGRVVKGTRFIDLKDAGDPVEIASSYDSENADEIIFLDITASHQKRKTMLDVASRAAEKIFIPLTIGGGIQDLSDIRNLLRSGADKISINTIAVQNPQIVKEASDMFGSQCIVVAIDAKRKKGVSVENKQSWEVYISGGRIPTGFDALEWAGRVERLGAGEILLTSMDRDGTKEGYDIELTQAISESVGIPVIASGGAGRLEHFYDAFAEGGASAVLAASLFHYGELSIGQVKRYLKEKGIEVRL